MIDTLKVEEGSVTLNDIPYTFTMLKSIYYVQKELEDLLGEKWKRIVYERGKADALDTVFGYISLVRSIPIQKIISIFDRSVGFKFYVDEYNRLGIGRVEVKESIPEKPLFVFRLYFSPIGLTYSEHEKTNEPVCHQFAGILAGGANNVYPGIEATEKKCIAKGDPYCEFILQIPAKRW